MNDIEKFLKKHNMPENQTVGGSLWLDGLTQIPDGFNPTVGGGRKGIARNGK